MAHELTHVLQQRSGPVAGNETGNGLSISDPSDAFERAVEANAERAMTKPVQASSEVAPAGSNAPAQPVNGSVQRVINATGLAGTAYQAELTAIRDHSSTARIRQFLAECAASNNTFLRFTAVPMTGHGLTEGFIYDGANRYDLDDPDNIDWSVVKPRTSNIDIVVSLNAAQTNPVVRIETLLHELAIHAVHMWDVVKRLRESSAGAAANSILHSHLDGSNSCEWQHNRLGMGRNRVISAEVANLGRVLGINLQSEYDVDVLDHEP